MIKCDVKRNVWYDDETPMEAKIRKNRIKRILRRQAYEAEMRAAEMRARPRCECGMILPRIGIRCICGK